jgi:replicative DNA helicase
MQLLHETPSALNTEGYGRIVERRAIRRRGLDAANQIIRVCHSEETDIEEVIAQMEQSVFSVTDRRLQNGYKPMGVLASEHIDHVNYMQRHHVKGTIPGPKSYLIDLDRLKGGYKKGEVTVFAGRPGMGKSSMLQGEAALNAEERHVALFSLEMGTEEIFGRLCSRYGKVDGEKIRDGTMDDKEYTRYLEATQVVAGLNLHIDDTPAITPMHLRSQLHRWILEFGIEIAFIDYVQLMSGGPLFHGKNARVQEMGFITSTIKSLAREFKIPIKMGAQLNRELEKRSDKRPILSDLRESGSIENDADCVMFVYRDDYYYEDSEAKGTAEVRIAKHRGGKTGKIDTAWLPEYTMFENFATYDFDPNAEIKKRMNGKEVKA